MGKTDASASKSLDGEPARNEHIRVGHITLHETGRLVGIGLYTPAEAGRLLSIRPAKISRWLRGHDANGKHYDPLWSPQVDLGEEGTFLGFRDLQEVRVASTFIEKA